MERAQKESSRAKRMAEQLQDTTQLLERLRQQRATPATADSELQVCEGLLCCECFCLVSWWEQVLTCLSNVQQALPCKANRLHEWPALRPVCHGMQAECTALRAMINCNVCHQRQKDVVITKCWHMFCQHCIRRNLGAHTRSAHCIERCG